jgi:hypothetical protein
MVAILSRVKTPRFYRHPATQGLEQRSSEELALGRASIRPRLGWQGEVAAAN